jgi:hypothetical protein
MRTHYGIFGENANLPVPFRMRENREALREKRIGDVPAIPRAPSSFRKFFGRRNPGTATKFGGKQENARFEIPLPQSECFPGFYRVSYRNLMLYPTGFGHWKLLGPYDIFIRQFDHCPTRSLVLIPDFPVSVHFSEVIAFGIRDGLTFGVRDGACLS